MNDDEYQCAMDDAAALGFWSGVCACMLAEARAWYAREARDAIYAISSGRELYDEDMVPFWAAVRDLQLLGEVGGEP